MIIFDVDHLEQKCTIINNDGFALINFDSLSDLINEIIFRTCKIVNTQYKRDSDEIVDGLGNLIKPIMTFKSIDSTLIQWEEIKIIPNPNNDILKEKLRKKRLKVENFPLKTLDELAPKLSHIGFTIEEIG